jgi:hypothetical protein
MTDEPKSLEEAEDLLRRRPAPRWDDRPPPEAVALWHEFRSWDGKCTCPPLSAAPYPGRSYDSSNPADRERRRQYETERAAYDAARAQCVACREQRRLDDELLLALGLRSQLKPWNFDSGIHAFPDIIAALNEAGAGNGSERPPPNRD